MEKDVREELIVSIARIPEQGLEISRDMPREWLDNIPEFSDDSGPHIEGDIHLTGRIAAEGGNLRLRGRVEADLVTICVRCGEEIHCPLDGEFDLTLLPGPGPELPEEMELTPEDVSQTYYTGDEVDLNPFFQEQVALEVPLQPLCREDCAGMCTSCGANLNFEKCGCEKKQGDPRLAVLRDLKIEK